MEQPFLLNPRFEPVLQGDRPKANSPANSHWGCMFLFLLPFLIVGAILFGRLINTAQLQYQLRTGGVSVQGNVNKTWVETIDASDFYHLRYRFSVDSQQYAPSMEITESLYERLGVGDELEILYSPQDPNVSLPAPSLNWFDLVSYVIANLLWNGLTLYLAGLYLRDWWTERQCLQKGQLLDTKITHLNVRSEDSGQVTLEARSKVKSPKSGKTLKGKVFVQLDSAPEAGFPEAPVSGKVLYSSDSRYLFL